MISAKQSRILVAGGGHAEIPLVKAAKSLGCHVITSGNQADGMAHQYADEVQLEDFSDKEAMLDLARNLHIDAICSSCNDFSALTCAYIAEQIGLPGHDSYGVSKILHHKNLFREFAAANAIPSPRAKTVYQGAAANGVPREFRYPVMVKPVDLTGGKGISKVLGASDLGGALSSAFQISREKHVVVEEFIEGSNHAISAFIREEKVVFCFHDDEYYFQNPYLVSGASGPGSPDASVVHYLSDLIEKMAGILCLVTGIVHIQYILESNGHPRIIEVCRRAPGDLYVELVRYVTGIDYASFIVRAALGDSCEQLAPVQPKGFFTRHCVMAPAAGRIREVRIAPELESRMVETLWLKHPGDYIQDHLTDKVGIVFIEFDSHEEMVENTGAMPEHIQVLLD